MITVSVVSHGHADLVSALLEDLARYPEVTRIVVTRNVPEVDIVVPPVLRERLMMVENPVPRGFGANHNAAFRRCETPFYCVVNPDVRMEANPFPALIDCLEKQAAALAAPAVLDSAGAVEDSIRRFPRPFDLIAKALGLYDGRYLFEPGAAPFAADWVGGMFMLFRAPDFAAVGSFDEGFFLYYEDVDICARLWKTGHAVVACPRAVVVHHARRASHRELRHLRWHLVSVWRYFVKHLGRLPNTNRNIGAKE
jgi:N-acetylglucosaminyl-diphospho-decaprenol L-rhamnosyltransferase